MSEQADRLRAGGRVIEDATSAHARGELSDHVLLGWRLATTALIMKPAHQPGAVKTARDYSDAVGINFDILAEQIEARIYEVVQFERLAAEVRSTNTTNENGEDHA